jgi:hypothetical protein
MKKVEMAHYRPRVAARPQRQKRERKLPWKTDPQRSLEINEDIILEVTGMGELGIKYKAWFTHDRIRVPVVYPRM